RYQRERAELEAAVPDKAAVQNSYPDWLVATLRRDWPGAWETVLGAGNRPGPMTLRVNTRRTTPAAYRQRLADAGIQAAPHPHAPQALTLAQPQAVTELPGFDAGEISVQDAAAQLAAPLLEIQPGMRVLDACAAPGGKTAHCLELADCTMTALDADPARVALVAQNLSRLGLACGVNLIHADATAARDWWDGQPFDRILVDAPCTGTGVIRRHPDIKWLRRETDVAALATRQQTLLDALWPSLAPGGLLVYATCSLLRAEGADVIRAFLASHPKAVEYPIEAAWGGRDRCGRRIASGEADMDGFYFARLRRPKNGGPGA
ncbi:MAG: 16S rRNA (cytosine(967)-C(5))-methyltransferase RsmB, partial [Salinisphaera sp.]|nr:16S rRNA (cytosine(967)-C(5))-methyltransferase RsmB [Salinisphaera sp.]